MANNLQNSEYANDVLLIDDEDKQLSFLDILESTIHRQKDTTFATWYDGKGKPTDKYTFHEMWEDAGAIAHNLRMKYNINKGDRVVLCYNFGLQFFAAFLGCLRAGIVAVLIYPPSPKNLPTALPKMTNVITDCDAKLVLVDNDVNLLRINPLSKSRSLWPKNVKFIVHPKKRHHDLDVSGISLVTSPIVPGDLAFLQYTSGSTGNPKGVMVTFGALKANVQGIISAIHRVCDRSGYDYSKNGISSFSWLPQYHDMGLIYAIIAPFTAGWNCHLTSPLEFIKNPLLWVDLMSRLRVTWSVAPNFAFRLAARKFMEAKTRDGGKDPIANLDLSSIVYLQNASEPIQTDTKLMFEEAFGKFGLSSNWFMSGYGLAETVVYATDLHEYKLSTCEVLEGRPLVASGHRDIFPKGQIAKIVCPDTKRELKEDGKVGELWLFGPSITAGYYGKPELTQQMFHAKLQDSDEVYLRTGDLAFFENDYLYICGRQKDLIISNGVNYYPQDIESAVQDASKAVRPGCVAAFSSDETGSDGDLEVVFEIRNEYVRNVQDIVKLIRTNIVEQVGLVPTRVVAIKERAIPKTTSGKIKRKATRTSLHDEKLEIVHEYTPQTLDFTSKVGDMVPNEQEGYKDYAADPFENIMVSFFGESYDPTMTWDDLGLSSMASVQLRDALSDSFAVTLPPDCFDEYPTPNVLKSFVLSAEGVPLEADHPSLPRLDHKNLSWAAMGCLQMLCSIALIFIFAFSIVPAWYVGKALAYIHAYVEVSALDSDVNIRWVWAPIIVPVWMVAFSFSVVALKWIVIWKYKEALVSIPSFAYLRWWFVDRAVAMWEFWVGRFIKDTPLINLFYYLMGAKVHSSVSMDAFIREFDLVNIQEGTSLQQPMNCRKFGSCNSEEFAYLYFRSIVIGRDCTLKGMVSLGTSVGDGAYIEKLSVTPEGSKVPEGARVVGNPGYIVGTSNPRSKEPYQCIIGMFKVLWLTFELYLFFGSMLLGQYLWVSYLPRNWRYAPILEWFLLILWFGSVSIVTSVIIKWVLIGKRKPGPFKDTLFRRIADWAADWHFQVAIGVSLSFTTHSRLWNIILMAHGMSIDFGSRVAGVGMFTPSKADLVKVHQSFISVASFNVKNENRYHSVSIEKSSVGLLAHLGPGDLNVSQMVVPPLTHLKDSVTHDDPRSRQVSIWEYVKQEVSMSLAYMMSFGLVFLTMIPAFEIWMNCFGNPQSIWLAFPALASALFIQTLSWTLVLSCVQYIALFSSEKSKKPWSNTLYLVYGTMAFAHQNYSFLTAFLGSPTYNCLVRLLGVKFEGRALLLPHRMYEYSYITIAENTIVDSSQITGHYAIYGDITVGHCRLSGIMHEGTYAANAMIAAGESDPWRAFVGSYQPHAKNTIDIKPFEDEGATMHVIDFSTFDATSGNGNVGSDHTATHSKTSTDDDVEAADGRSITKNQLPTDMAVLGYDDVSEASA